MIATKKNYELKNRIYAIEFRPIGLNNSKLVEREKLEIFIWSIYV